ncbi:3-hydroxyacyl-CoA dehydrogenase [Chryseotalea sanaruensis]|uniref:3-hydroxyacyl-CoA dehydrogenase n=1 Tax=Chryseotalea sanaruensis TaxID=2482724 RepID=A0A401UCC4_9BACT|nr:3-hydroxyacyl-CoA dehydrogenase family protein [Chryseotalea sanaruensis]GCC52548.1 3-hydroxyacyl-CoA dehydrogenase [Chryseotalea sanaruensis]
MNLIVIGTEQNLSECKAKFGDTHTYAIADNYKEAGRLIETDTVIFDFLIDEIPTEIEFYLDLNVVAFLSTAKRSLLDLTYGLLKNPEATLFGFNGMPTFLNRSLLEVAVLHVDDRSVLEKTCQDLNSAFTIVEDRAGLVTPRIICMIINEAYFTVQEGTATREDIDMAMKLGTNYPYGPFEWCKRIGIKNVYELLEAVYEDTKDERYKICPLLKREYLQQ